MISFAYKHTQPSGWQGLLVMFALSLLFLPLAVIAGKMDLQKEYLIGPVRTARIETARFSNPSGHWVEEPREPKAYITYDVRGNKTVVIGNDASGKTTHTYDAQGNRMEEVHYGSDGTFYNKLGYIYDDKGKLTEIISYGSDGSPLGKQTA